jgi:hypothetical protein
MGELIGPASHRWRRIIERQVSSGLSASAYCQRNGIAASSFFAWKRRLRLAGPQFVEVKTAEADSLPLSGAQPRSEPIEILLRGGRSVRVPSGFDPALLGQIVVALESLPESAS